MWQIINSLKSKFLRFNELNYSIVLEFLGIEDKWDNNKGGSGSPRSINCSCGVSKTGEYSLATNSSV